VRAAASKCHASNRGAASLARRAATLVDGEALLHLTVAIGSRVIVNRRAARGHRLAEQRDDRIMKTLRLCRSERGSNRERVQASAPECLIDIDISEPSDESLIEEETLQSTTAALQTARKP
jgi:hypothetical protein